MEQVCWQNLESTKSVMPDLMQRIEPVGLFLISAEIIL